jgi:hypothetical protein
MIKDYYLEIWLNTRWHLVDTFKNHREALENIAERAGDRYPMRLVKVTRTIVFGEGKENVKKKKRKPHSQIQKGKSKQHQG